ncbi:MAG TPA: alpha/beta hydrolase [Terriglobales bacterium]|nr:alpha/beta hydrolase [Terriglobales bacterium]
MLDPKIQEMLAEFEREGLPQINTLPVGEARRLSREAVEQFARPKKLHLVRNILAEIGTARIPVRVYVPREQNGLPALVYYHGGGWVVGDLDTADTLCRSIALASDCVVFSVDYRLAPENKFPTPLEDSFRTAKWIAKNGFGKYADVSRLAVGGDSAGGNLAAAACLKARGNNDQFISYQLLICPVTNHSFDTESYRNYADGYLLTMKDMEWFWNHYLQESKDGENPYASPLLANLHSLPPAHVITAEYDPLRDEGEMYARQLSEAHVPTKMTRYDSMIHCFTDYPELKQTTQVVEEIAEELRRVFRAA